MIALLVALPLGIGFLFYWTAKDHARAPGGFFGKLADWDFALQVGITGVLVIVALIAVLVN